MNKKEIFSGQHIIIESAVMGYPKNIKPLKNNGEKIRMECILQTVGDVNRNNRMYDKNTMQKSIKEVLERMHSKNFHGELDHPVDSNPVRQSTVLYKEASHNIIECGWDGNILKGVVETLCATCNGRTMRDLVVKDEIPIGFSYRGMGELEKSYFNGKPIFKVTGPMTTITWDCVSYPSHAKAKIIKITEGVKKQIKESVDYTKIIELNESSGLICTEDGVCFLPNDYDRYVEERKKRIKRILGY